LAKYKVRKGFSIGSLAAENDALLHEVYVDSGYMDRLCDPNDRAFLLLGRSGSGKTALLRQMAEIRGQDHVVQLDPDELSMQYLQNSVLRELTSWDVNLEIFYKYLWRHVCM
jgi:SpoVK/Ycf46/Vps4 family AAA+-type ATPase